MLSLNNVDAYYGKSHVLHEVSLEFGSNEIVALLGRNGAGKTTTIRSIMGLMPRVEGEILFKETSLVGMAPDKVFKKGISWVPEEQRIFVNLSVEENLKLGGLHSGKRGPEQYEEVFELFPRLEERREQIARGLSGGERQMLALARALLCDPDLLLVDEPYEGLMPQLVDDVADVLDELSERDMSIFMTEQKMDDTLRLADRAYVMENGQIVYEGDANELLEDTELRERLLGVKRQ